MSNAMNPFDPANLRLSQNFTEAVGVKTLLTTIPVRKPNRQDFVRVHPDSAYRCGPVGVLELKEDRETFLVAPSMVNVLAGEYATVTLHTAITRQGVVFLWPVKLPAPDGRQLAWHTSAAEAAEKAMDHWVRVSANMNLGAYDIALATATLPEPEWPTHTPEEILRIAFRGHMIDREDHPVVRRLRGDA
jgi:hypothetical protein